MDGNLFKVIIAIFTAVIGPLLVWLVTNRMRNRNKKSAPPIESKFEYEIYEKIKALFEILRDANNPDYKMILEIGIPINDALFERGLFSSLIFQGEIIKDAAIKLRNEEVRAKMLIEHIGWVHNILGDKIKAEENISKGIQVARENKNLFLEAKGLRHLVGIFVNKDLITENDIEKSFKKLREAEFRAKQISDDVKKAEALAPIFYGFAELYLLDNNLNIERAINYNSQSSVLYTKVYDKKVTIKILIQLGKIGVRQNELDKAIAAYYDAYQASKNEGRRDYEMLSLNGLIRCYEKSGNTPFVNKYKRELRELEKRSNYDLKY